MYGPDCIYVYIITYTLVTHFVTTNYIMQKYIF